MVRINAILTEDTLVKIDAIAKEKKKSRCSFLREADEKLIGEYQRQKQRKRERIRHRTGYQRRNQVSGMVFGGRSGENTQMKKFDLDIRWSNLFSERGRRLFSQLERNHLLRRRHQQSHKRF